MDVILHCFFDNFNDLERGSLHARYKRKEMVEYFNTMIEGCCRGERCNPEKTVREAILGILRYHDKTKNDNGGICLMGKFHNILYVAVKLCYDWQLKDTEIVAVLLENIYSCEKTFERLSIGAIFGTRAPHFIAGWKSDFDDQEENLRALVFYIDHATTAGLEFLCGDCMIRFIDVPFESCGKASAVRILAQLGVPDKLHILLRFGALVSANVSTESLFEVVLNRLSEFEHVYPFNLVACLQLLLRVVPRILLAKEEGNEMALSERYAELVEDGVLPATRCGLSAPELKHLSRCVVRESLWRNFQLPGGIEMLPIPKSLKRYIDILED